MKKKKKASSSGRRVAKKKPAKRSGVRAKPAKRARASAVVRALADRRVAEFMTVLPLTIGKDQTLTRAHELMRKHNIRHLPVLDGGVVFGIVSQRDLHLVETLRDVDPNQVTVEEATSRDPYSVRYDAPLGQVAKIMADKKLGATLVVDDDERIVGVFTTIDALRAIVS